MSRPDPQPLLSVTVPTYERVALLERCLASLLPTHPDTARDVEVVVSDNSTTADTEVLVAQFATSSPVPVRYHRNPPGTGAVGNFNRCVERARGRYNLMLHDDDFLLPGGVDAIVGTLRAAPGRDRVFLFGVQTVELDGRVRRRQVSGGDRFLPPAAALTHLLGNSSYVRVPGLVVESELYRTVGGFRPGAHTTCDFDMSVRLFGTCGVRLVPQVTSAYTIHDGSVTSTVFTAQTIDRNLEVFARARSLAVLDDATIDRLARRWFHQFVLAGTWRALRVGDRAAARERLALFRKEEIRSLGPSPRWLGVRVAFGVLAGARPGQGGADRVEAARPRDW